MSAAAEAVLEVMEEEMLLENVNKVGNYLMDELRRIEGIKEVRGRGLMIGIEFEEPIKEIRHRLLFEEHVFTGVSGTNVIRLLPPLTLTLAEAEEFIRRFKRSMIIIHWHGVPDDKNRHRTSLLSLKV